MPLFTPIGGGGIGKATVTGTTGSPTIDTTSRPGKTIYKFLSGTGSITIGTAGTAEVLLVGGGGAGSKNYGGGGGAGGFLYKTSQYFPVGTFNVGVGAGGTNNGFTGSNGMPSYIGDNLAALGGGAGGITYGSSFGGGEQGGNGGSGGGSAGNKGAGSQGRGMPGQGYDGGYNGGFGSGSGGGAGGAAGTSNPSTIGPGVSNSITGTAVTYSAGGYGGSSVGTAGSANTGNGGGGGDNTAGNGGSGVVIVVIG